MAKLRLSQLKAIDGRDLRPLTPEVIARHPDLDPRRHDVVASNLGGWVGLDGIRQAPRLISKVCLPDDDLYYWDGPYVGLTGSSGIAVVRRGIVVDTFTTRMA